MAAYDPSVPPYDPRAQSFSNSPMPSPARIGRASQQQQQQQPPQFQPQQPYQPQQQQQQQQQSFMGSSGWGDASGGSMGGFPTELVAGTALKFGAEKVEGVRKNMSQYVDVGRVKFYFAVDTNYVLQKLRLILFPYLHKNWERNDHKGERVSTPREDINCPDLYIPVMSFLTYILLVGVALGLSDKFSPEMLGVSSSSTLGWLLVEVFLYYAAFYVVAMPNVSIIELIAFSSYKYVGMIVALSTFLITRSDSLYIVTVLFVGVGIAYFILRSLYRGPATSSMELFDVENKKKIYPILVMAVLQLAFIYFFTARLVSGVRSAGNVRLLMPRVRTTMAPAETAYADAEAEAYADEHAN